MALHSLRWYFNLLSNIIHYYLSQIGYLKENTPMSKNFHNFSNNWLNNVNFQFFIRLSIALCDAVAISSLLQIWSYWSTTVEFDILKCHELFPRNFNSQSLAIQEKGIILLHKHVVLLWFSASFGPQFNFVHIPSN